MSQQPEYLTVVFKVGPGFDARELLDDTGLVAAAWHNVVAERDALRAQVARLQAAQGSVVEVRKLWYMRDNHTFKPLANDVEAAISELRAEFDDGQTYGMLCATPKGALDVVHASSAEKWGEFEQAARAWLSAALATPQPEPSPAQEAADTGADGALISEGTKTAPATSGFLAVVPGSFVPNPEMSTEVPGLTKAEVAQYVAQRRVFEPAPVAGDERQQIEQIARAHGTGGWQTLDDMVRFGLAVRAALAAQLPAERMMVPLADMRLHELWWETKKGSPDANHKPYAKALIKEFCRINGLTVGGSNGGGKHG